MGHKSSRVAPFNYGIVTLVTALTIGMLWTAFAKGQAALRQNSSPAAKLKPSRSGGKAWAPPRTADGHPDLEGIWDSASLTPLERPSELGDKQFFTREEATVWEEQRKKELNRDRRDGGLQADEARSYNEGWFDRGTKVGRNLRTSLVIDPPDGKIPPFTLEAQKRYDKNHAYYAAHPADGPEDRPLPDRCLLFSQGGPPLIPGNYNNNYEIEQNASFIAILSEDGSQVRIIPTDGRPHLPPTVLQWSGDSRGHWEKDALVVDTTNLRFNDQTRFGVVYDGMTDQNLHIVERFTRTAADMITYRATINDPTVYSKPWTMEVIMSKAPGPIFEYACNEGNYALPDILAGARAEEQKAAEATSK